MIKLKANAKINLTLDILGKRADGYHEVAMVMQSVGLFDEVSLTKTDEGISLFIDVPDLPTDENNLAVRAARLFFDEQNIKGGVRIEIKKNIPVAAGLAGGSTDAAAVIKGLNELYDTHLRDEELCKLGEKIGSDVPFCIMGGTMLATGRGEVLKRLKPMSECFVVLAKPQVSVSTAWAYKTYDASPATEHPDNEALIKAIEEDDFSGVCKLLVNVLEEVTKKEHEEIDEYKRIMKENGATACLMSGSGPTVFALTKDKETAEKIAEKIKKSTNPQAVHVVKTVN